MMLHWGGIGVAELAEQFGTPLYVYDAAILRRSYRELTAALDGFAEVYFSIKANPNPGVVRIFRELGAGLEVASGAEFAVCQSVGADPRRVVFAGPGKGVDELRQTIAAGIGEIHLESDEEIAHCARLGRELGRVPVDVSIRVNPLASAQGGAMRMGGKPAAFGFDEETLPEVLARIPGELRVRGIHMFAGTQILDAEVLLLQWRHGLDVAARVAEMLGRPLDTIDLGGGLGIPYHSGDKPLDLGKICDGVPALRACVPQGTRVMLEPGRFLAGPAGAYLMRVRAVKQSRGTRFVIADGGMHHHLAASGNLGQVIKRDYPIVAATRMEDREVGPAMLCGPLCTPLDTLGRQTPLPLATVPGDLIAVLQSGAYGLTASPSAFLSHPKPAEVLVDGDSGSVTRL